jgi:hypothetical protein
LTLPPTPLPAVLSAALVHAEESEAITSNPLGFKKVCAGRQPGEGGVCGRWCQAQCSTGAAAAAAALQELNKRRRKIPIEEYRDGPDGLK